MMKAKCKKRVFKVMGADWAAHLWDGDVFIKKFDPQDQLLAFVIKDYREFHFRKDRLSIGTCRHEVRHAFTKELCTESAFLSAYQMEEIQCELDSNRWADMNKLSRDIFKWLKG